MNKKLLLLITLLFQINAFAQLPSLNWVKSMGGPNNEIANSIAIDANKNVYTVGSFEGTVDFDPSLNNFQLTSSGLSDFFISKLDSAGNFVWAKRIGSIGDDIANGISIDINNNLYITGEFQNIVDFNPNVGTANLSSIGSSDIFILKLDNNGNFIWAKSVGGASYDVAKSIKVDLLGNSYTTGSFQGAVDFNPNIGTNNLSSGGSDIFILKLDNVGNYIWAKQMGGGNQSVGFSITLDGNNNVLTTGTFNGSGDFDPGINTFNLSVPGFNYNTFISKLDASGNFIWAKSFSGLQTNEGFGIAVDNLNNVYTTGELMNTADFDPNLGAYNLTSSISFNYDAYVCKLDASGNFIWAKSFLGIGLAVTVNSSNQVFFSNWNSTFTKLDPIGNTIWNINSGRGHAIALEGNSSIYLTGKFSSTVDFDPSNITNTISAIGGSDIFIKKLNNCQNTYNSISVTNCNNVTVNGVTYSSSGTYTQTLTNSVGCDSILTIIANITIVDTTITLSGSILSSNAIGSTYQWVKCNPFTIIAGATNQQYTAISNADYAVIITQNGCIDTSKCIKLTNLSINENALNQNLFSIFPNPIYGEFIIKNEKNIDISQIEIFNTLGAKIKELNAKDLTKYTFDISTLTPNIYILKISTSEGAFFKKIQKQ